jgi:hypothetical protein
MKYFKAILFFYIFCQFGWAEEVKFKITYLHQQPAKVTITQTKSDTIFEVKSKFGIGRAKVELLKGSWPNKSILRLYLKGLEGIIISGSDQKLERSDLAISRKESKGVVYFDILLPQSLFEATEEIEFSWVDFYR